jgi:hypothetical protein
VKRRPETGAFLLRHLLLSFSGNSKKAAPVTTRSRLLTNVLRTWDQSVEGYLYLRWLIDPNVADCLARISVPELEGGDVLREAVVDILEGPGLQKVSMDKAIDEFCSELSPEDASLIRKDAPLIASWLIELQEIARERSKPFHTIGLELFAWMNQNNNRLSESGVEDDFPNEALDRFRESVASEKLSAAITALSRTTAEARTPAHDPNMRDQARKFFRQLLLDPQWREEHAKTKSILQTFHEWRTAEALDRYYASQLATRLDQIVERASGLDEIKLEIANIRIKRLFQDAHETFLFGFDVACIALCRSLAEHALKEKLPQRPGEAWQLGALIERAEREKILEGPVLEGARVVLRAGNAVMHKFPNPWKTAQEVLDCTRSILDVLYGAGREESAELDDRVY